MKKIRNILIILFLMIFIILIGAYIYLKSTVPEYEGSVVINGINEQVDIHYDTYGIPHIYAQNSDDAYFALGYAHAKDRLFQMEIIRRLVSGRMAEILGPTLIETDKYMHTLGLRDAAERSAKMYMSGDDKPFQKAALAYLKGINHYQDTGKTPIEFSMLGIEKETFVPADIYTTTAYMSLGFSAAIKEEPFTSYIKNNLGFDYIKDWYINTEIQSDDMLMSDTTISNVHDKSMSFLSAEEILREVGLPIWTGSNGWVLSGERSQSGKVILANDTHIAHAQPSVWYEAHIEYPGFSFYGNYLATVPFAVIGHNQNLGWGLTIFPLDNLDLYKEKINPKNPDEVWAIDHWEPLNVKQKIIKVKDEADILFDVQSSRHGPIINKLNKLLEVDDAPIALWWEAIRGESKVIEALFQMNRAQDIDEFKAHLHMVDIIGLNVLYGDVEDNIAWWGTGRMPKRKMNVHSKFMLDGASGNDDILGYYDFSEFPSIINPPSGLIVSANHEPDSSAASGVVFPGYYTPKNRFNRLSYLLNSKEKWNQEELKALHLDVRSEFHAENTSLLYSIISDQNKDSNDTFFNGCLDILKSWNGDYRRDDRGPIVYQKLIYHVMEYNLADDLPVGMYDKMVNSYVLKRSLPKLLFSKESPWWDDKSTKDKIETRSDIVMKAFHKTVSELRIQMGMDIDSWKWENVHHMTHVHPIGRKKPFDKLFNVGPFDVEGGNGVPNKLEFVNNPDGTYEVISGPAIRILLDFNDIESSESINPTGQSGVFMSPYYQDQAQMYATGKYRKQLMNKEEILKDSRKFSLLKSK